MSSLKRPSQQHLSPSFFLFFDKEENTLPVFIKWMIIFLGITFFKKKIHYKILR